MGINRVEGHRKGIICQFSEAKEPLSTNAFQSSFHTFYPFWCQTFSSKALSSTNTAPVPLECSTNPNLWIQLQKGKHPRYSKQCLFFSPLSSVHSYFEEFGKQVFFLWHKDCNLIFKLNCATNLAMFCVNMNWASSDWSTDPYNVDCSRQAVKAILVVNLSRKKEPVLTANSNTKSASARTQ